MAGTCRGSEPEASRKADAPEGDPSQSIREPRRLPTASRARTFLALPAFVWAGFHGVKFPPPLRGRDRGGYGGVEGRSPLHEPAQPVSAVCPLVLTPMGSVARRPPSLTLPLKGGGDRSAPPCRTMPNRGQQCGNRTSSREGGVTPHARDEVRFPPIPTMPSSVWRRGHFTPSFLQTPTPVIPAKAGIHPFL